MVERSGRLTGPRAWDLEPVRRLLPAVAALLAVLVLGSLVLGQSRDDQGVDPPALPRREAFPAHYTNIAAGYSFGHPAGWIVTEEGATTRVRDPGGYAIVTFGHLGSSEDVLAASIELVARIERSYAEVEPAGKRARAETLGGALAVIREGTAVNSEGTRLRFVAVAVEGCPRPGVIIAFRRRGDAAARFDRAIERVIDSYDGGCPE